MNSHWNGSAQRGLTRRDMLRSSAAGFGGLALLLAAIGTYGVMAYSVSQRTQEIGIRMALGAQRGNVLKLILGNGMAMVMAGVVVGLGATLIFTRSISSLLYGIGNFDAISFIGAAIALIASWFAAVVLIPLLSVIQNHREPGEADDP